MPTVNKQCIEAALLTALSLHCKINRISYFERKHYYYADLPMGYQITQQKCPIAYDGFLEYPIIDNGKKAVTLRKCSIRRVQIEHDSGRTLKLDEQSNLIDLNRCGFGLMEIVTEPDFIDSTDTCSFLEELTRILKACKTCDVNMRDGGFRVDVNISVHSVDPNSSQLMPSPRVELKNINNISSVSKAINYELSRQMKLKQNDTPFRPQTRTFDSITGTTELLREKEDAYDYRFMPEPNLLPIYLWSSVDRTINLDETVDFQTPKINHFANDLTGAMTVMMVDFDEITENFRKNQQPGHIRKILHDKYGLTLFQANTLYSKRLHTLFMSLVDANEDLTKLDQSTLKIYNKILLDDYLTYLNLNGDLENRLTFEWLSDYLKLYKSKKINHTIGRMLFDLMLDPENQHQKPSELLDKFGLHIITDEDLIVQCINRAMDENEALVDTYVKNGKKRRRINLKFYDIIQSESNNRIDSKNLANLLNKILENKLAVK
jgi:aspartyl-tRNA(Asn)/glutamyl-tRNA(Gln) amidotransferase subunit B